MTFPSSNGSRQESLDLVWDRARSIASEIKSWSQTFRAQAAAGTASNVILNYVDFLANKKAQLAALVTVPGIAAYAQAQINDATLNIATEYTSMSNAISAVISWVITNTPKDGSGYILGAQFNADNSGHVIYRQFSAATLGGLLSVVDALIATID